MGEARGLKRNTDVGVTFTQVALMETCSMTTKQMIDQAEAAIASAKLLDALRVASSCETCFPLSDPTGGGPTRDVRLSFPSVGAATAFVDAVKAASRTVA
jgi:hypothetical protein